MKKTICDRCGVVIIENPIKICLEEVDRKTGDFSEEQIHTDLADIDLCRSCSISLANEIRLFCHRIPAIINQDFEDAVQEMIATSQKESP